ncbi:ExbD/TolR family protein [Flagellimonas pacifica]|uniref:Biopolymer transport protein ExbD n=1 Tax=Flagellimonas pacifica TaxID=1247520 RepID=A0A285MV92_9FLAO|nr:biopolymer transporter ExbD [Allomuricauda parva]SNZ01105.1 Biopolymer transport protein ExbD [Allomuricauda parva]
MRNFRNNKSKLPAISTASLPDIVFMLLFFFMTVTTIKDNTLLVDNNLPNATEVKKLEKKDRIIEIFVGKPAPELASVLGSEPKIQLDDRLASVTEVSTYVLSELAKKPESIRNYVTVSLKVDKEVKVGVVSDIKEELRKVNLLKVNYTTYEGDAFRNMQ